MVPHKLRRVTGSIFFAIVVLNMVTQALAGATQTGSSGSYETSRPKEGDRCLICGVRLTDDDVVLLVRGRRVPLKKTMVDSFLNNKAQYFAEMQPRGALFQEEMGAREGVALGGITIGWFVFGLYVLAALVFAGLSANVAVSKGLSPLPSFFIGLSFTVLGFLYVVTRKSTEAAANAPRGLRKVPNTAAPSVCAKCDGMNHPSAATCASCGARLEPLSSSDVSRVK